MSFLTDAEAASLCITKMILHVVGDKEKFKPQPLLEGEEHVEFFKARILDAAIDGVHQFQDESETKTLLQAMGADQTDFRDGAVELSRQFSKVHVGASKDGAFFVFELECDDPGVRLYSLIKYDYRQAIELYARNGRNALRQIVQAFVREKRAIQKSCLVRFSNGKIEPMVSAFDRMGESPDLTEYFQKFLGVERHRNNRELSDRLREVVRKTLQECKEHLPNQDVPAAIGATKDFLRGRMSIDNDAIREALLVAAGRPEEGAAAVIDKTLTRHLKQKKLFGVSFRPSQTIFQRAPRRKLRTAEGVTIEYPGEQENRTVTRTQNKTGGWTITVKTDEPLEEDATLPDRSSPDA